MSDIRNNVAGVIGAANDLWASSQTKLQSYERAPFAKLLPPKTRETVRLESESDQALLERPIPKPNLKKILMPTPIIDNIKEEDKYGNNGDQFIGVGQTVVNGFEGISNFLNRIFEVTKTFITF